MLIETSAGKAITAIHVHLHALQPGTGSSLCLAI
jgi:hypothetical protein